MNIWVVGKWITSLSLDNRFLRVGKSDNKEIALPQSMSVTTVHQQSEPFIVVFWSNLLM